MKKNTVTFKNVEMETFQLRDVLHIHPIIDYNDALEDESLLIDNECISDELQESYIAVDYNNIVICDEDKKEIINVYDINNVWPEFYDWYNINNLGQQYTNDIMEYTDYKYITHVGGQHIDDVTYTIELNDDEIFDVTKLKFIFTDTLDGISDGICLDHIEYDK